MLGSNSRGPSYSFGLARSVPYTISTFLSTRVGILAFCYRLRTFKYVSTPLMQRLIENSTTGRQDLQVALL